MSAEDLFYESGPATPPHASAFRRMTSKLLPASSPMTPEQPLRRPRPPGPRESPRSNDSSPASPVAGRDRLANMDVTASVVHQLRQATRRNTALEAARLEAAEKARGFEEQIASLTAKNERLTGENRKLGERLWEIENEFYQLSERNRELDDALKKKDGELRALVERSRRAMDLIEEAKSAEASIRRERDELTHQNQTIQASMRRLRMEWQTEKADLMRQLRDLLQEVEDYRRGGTGGLVSRQTSTSALPEEPDSGSSLPAAEDARSDPPSPASPASPSEARILITGEREDMSPLDLLKNSAKELLRLLAEFDRARLFGTLEASDSEMQSILDVLKEVYMTIGDRSGASADAASKNGTDEPAEEALPQIGSSLLTIFEHGCVGRTEQSEAIESPNVGEETPTTAFVPPDEEFAGSTTKDSSPASSPRGQSRNRMPLVSSGSLIRRDTNTDRDRPRSVLARLASLGNISRRFSVAETTADGTMGTENASMRSDSSGFETTPIDMSQMPNDEALFALTQCMVGTRMLKYNKYGRRPQERYLWINPFTCTIHWSSHDPSLENTGATVKTARITNVSEGADNSAGPRRRPLRSLVVETPSRQIRLATATQEEHNQWLRGLSELLKRQSSPGAAGKRLTLYIPNE